MMMMDKVEEDGDNAFSINFDVGGDNNDDDDSKSDDDDEPGTFYDHSGDDNNDDKRSNEEDIVKFARTNGGDDVVRMVQNLNLSFDEYVQGATNPFGFFCKFVMRQDQSEDLNTFWNALREHNNQDSLDQSGVNSVKPHVYARGYSVRKNDFEKTGMKNVRIVVNAEGNVADPCVDVPQQFQDVYVKLFVSSENSLWDHAFQESNPVVIQYLQSQESPQEEVAAYLTLKAMWGPMIDDPQAPLWDKNEQYQARTIGNALYGLPFWHKEATCDNWTAGADYSVHIDRSPVVVTAKNQLYEEDGNDAEVDFRKWETKPDFFLMRRRELTGKTKYVNVYECNIEEKAKDDSSVLYKALTTGALSLKSMNAFFEADMMFHLVGTRVKHVVTLALLCLDTVRSTFIYATETYNLTSEEKLRNCAKVLWNYVKHDVLEIDSLKQRQTPTNVVNPTFSLESKQSKSESSRSKRKSENSKGGSKRKSEDSKSRSGSTRGQQQNRECANVPREVSNMKHMRMLSLSQSETPKVGQVLSGELNGARVYIKCTEHVDMDIDIHEELSKIVGFNLPHIIRYSEEENYYIMSNAGRCRYMPTTQRRLMTVMRRALEQVLMLHSADWIHRDIKPSNLCVNQRSLDVTLIDWELAMEIDHDDLPTNRVGTKGYMAPEVDAKEPYSFACDTYSMGRTLKRMSSGVSGELDPRLVEIMDELCENDATKRLGIRDALDRLKRISTKVSCNKKGVRESSTCAQHSKLVPFSRVNQQARVYNKLTTRVN